MENISKILQESETVRGSNLDQSRDNVGTMSEMLNNSVPVLVYCWSSVCNAGPTLKPALDDGLVLAEIASQPLYVLTWRT